MELLKLIVPFVVGFWIGAACFAALGVRQYSKGWKDCELHNTFTL